MKQKRRLLVISAIMLIAILVIAIHLPRRGKLYTTPGVHDTALASPAASPTVYLSVSPSPTVEPIDVSYYEEMIHTFTAQNEMLREDLYKAANFVNLEDLSSSIIIDLKYAASDNFTGTAVYPVSVCVLRAETAQKLIEAEARFEALGYRIKVWDAYRPLSSQWILYEATEDKTFIADPQNGSRHNRGAAVDITLTDLDGNELEMPSDFDEFAKSRRDNPDISETAKEHMDLLTSVMTECGFTTIACEWWHFDDSDWQNYPVLDLHLESFAEASVLLP